MLLGMWMADASLSERRTSLGSRPWTEALQAFLAIPSATDRQALREDDLLIADRYSGRGKRMSRLETLPQMPMFLLRL